MPLVPPLSMGFDFGKMVEKMTDPRYARVRHILIEEKGEEARARLEGVKNEIAGDVDKFSEFAEQMSTCTSAVRQRGIHAWWIFGWGGGEQDKIG